MILCASKKRSWIEGLPYRIFITSILHKSRPVSRVLSRTVIHLGHVSPHASSDLPGNNAGRAWLHALRHAPVPLFGLAPSGVYPATSITRGAVRSYRTFSPLLASLSPSEKTIRKVKTAGGIFSVALSVDSRPPGVTWRFALWSPDFPLYGAKPKRLLRYSDCPVDSCDK
uniref:Uncharacterized protein n=1 Tax=Candidatus Kentrum sp. LPFa TaxID=2126335 RepID=A0A450W4M0_9GAMM|nr:MAG: hypothetical protein BECKLPF1236B_GA0070989_102819 [Candidatus Kentron sp. LPFa]